MERAGVKLNKPRKTQTKNSEGVPQARKQRNREEEIG
jgi:hypothetical protein